MNDKISQDTINKALWAACDTFRGTISADTYKDFILTMHAVPQVHFRCLAGSL